MGPLCCFRIVNDSIRLGPHPRVTLVKGEQKENEWNSDHLQTLKCGGASEQWINRSQGQIRLARGGGLNRRPFCGPFHKAQAGMFSFLLVGECLVFFCPHICKMEWKILDTPWGCCKDGIEKWVKNTPFPPWDMIVQVITLSSNEVSELVGLRERAQGVPSSEWRKDAVGPFFHQCPS